MTSNIENIYVAPIDNILKAFLPSVIHMLIICHGICIHSSVKSAFKDGTVLKLIIHHSGMQGVGLLTLRY